MEKTVVGTLAFPRLRSGKVQREVLQREVLQWELLLGSGWGKRTIKSPPFAHGPQHQHGHHGNSASDEQRANQGTYA
jgi:hypothetical protein